MRRFLALGCVLAASLAALSCSTTRVDVDGELSHLQDPHWQVRASAAEALGRAKAARAIPALRKALVDDGPEVRAAALMALAALRAHEAQDDIRVRIRDDADNQVVVQAIFALSVLARADDEDRNATIDLLVSKLTEETERVDSAARRVLDKIFGREALVASIRADLRANDPAVRARASKLALALHFPQLSGWERPVLLDTDAAARRDAYEELGRDPEPSDMGPLVRGLEDTSVAVRLAAAAGLDELGDPESVPALTRIAGSDPDASVREEAALAIAWMAGARGGTLPALWHFAAIEDRVTLDPSGSCTLARTLTIVIDRCPEAISNLALVVPGKFTHVDRVEDASGATLPFDADWTRGHRRVDFNVPPIAVSTPATFTVVAHSKRPLAAPSAHTLELTYSPAPLQARADALRITVATPGAGSPRVFERTSLEPRDAESLVVHVPVERSSLSADVTPPRSYSLREDVAAIAGIVAVVLGALAAIVLWIRRKRFPRADRMILVAGLTAGAVLLLSPMLLEDNLTYYALARSAVLDGDLDRANEYADYNQTQVYIPDFRGPLDPVLASVGSTPAVAAGHVLAGVLDAVGPVASRNGFSFPYLFLTAVLDFLAVLIGCLACFSIVERRIGASYALWSVVSVVAGTNLLLFAYAWTASSFQPSFMLFAVFLDTWDRRRDRRTSIDWLGGGALIGLLAMTRTLNLGFAVIPFMSWLMEGLTQGRASVAALVRHVGRGLLFLLGLAVAFAPQLVLQHLVDQTWLVDAYGVGTGRFTGFFEHLDGLFLQRVGLFRTMPFMAVALVGLVPLCVRDRRLGALVTAALGLQILAIASYEIYWGYFWYGTPYLVPSSPIFCLSIASLFRALRLRWPRAGPAAAALGVAACSAWNAAYMARQLGTKMVGDEQSSMGLAPLLHAMLLLNRKLDDDVLRVSSEFGCLLREMVGGLRAHDAGPLLSAFGFTLILVFGALAVAFGGAILRRLGSHVPERRRLAVAAGCLASIWLSVCAWLFVLGARTNLDYEHFVQRQWVGKRELSMTRLQPGQTFEWSYESTNPADRLSVITFLDEALDVPAGEPVATVDITSGDAHSQVALRAGVDTADFEVDRPESAERRAHGAPLDRSCFEWRVRDDSSHFYTARAYCSAFATPVPDSTTKLRLTSTLSHGALDVVLATARERKIPRDRTRRRWLAERW